MTPPGKTRAQRGPRPTSKTKTDTPPKIRPRAQEKPSSLPPVRELQDARVFAAHRSEYQAQKFGKYFQITQTVGALARVVRDGWPALLARDSAQRWNADARLKADPAAEKARSYLISLLENYRAQGRLPKGGERVIEELKQAPPKPGSSGL